MAAGSVLFNPLTVSGLTLKNRITMAPLFLGYANPDGSVSGLLRAHYQEMAASGAALIVVENAAVDGSGLGSPFVLRMDGDQYLEGLTGLAETIRAQGARAFLQINHAGRYAYTPERLAPSAFETGGVVPKPMNREDMDRVLASYVSAARLVRQAGFDGVEIHGGTGYLLAQFLSPRTNLRSDEYGGSLANRMRYPLAVVDAVKKAVGDFPVGYRFLASELLPGGLSSEESLVYARELDQRGLAYISVMAGTYDSFFLPEVAAREKEEAYMADYAAAVKSAVKTPVIAAGRIQTPQTAERILQTGQADLIGLARVLWADPDWVRKASGKLAEPVNACEPSCSLCLKRVMTGKPAYCARWPREKRENFMRDIGEKPAEHAGER